MTVRQHRAVRAQGTLLFSLVVDQYESFLRMIHEWWNLKMLKQSGKGHDQGRIELTKPGECAVLCLACPQLDINLLMDWLMAPPSQRYVSCCASIISVDSHSESRWLYCMFLALDANFQLKCKNVSSKDVNPGLGDGWVYFVEDHTYKEYLSKWMGEVQEANCLQKSTCSGHTAVNTADTKGFCGLAVTGLGTVDCSYHGFKLPLGVGDLQKGEK
ncbi:hypothetical protein JVU11DRAFT_6252 [Chiua virens]|nr:hypothetical protein JVU11DRAFT_6252 [Chiua virens]